MISRNLGDLACIVILQLIDVADDLALIRTYCRQ
jgi:hypothetical protein